MKTVFVLLDLAALVVVIKSQSNSTGESVLKCGRTELLRFIFFIYVGIHIYYLLLLFIFLFQSA